VAHECVASDAQRAAAAAAMDARVGATCSVVEAEKLVRLPVSLIW
jgi:hypothetical protein